MVWRDFQLKKPSLLSHNNLLHFDNSYPDTGYELRHWHIIDLLLFVLIIQPHSQQTYDKRDQTQP